MLQGVNLTQSNPSEGLNRTTNVNSTLVSKEKFFDSNKYPCDLILCHKKIEKFEGQRLILLKNNEELFEMNRYLDSYSKELETKNGNDIALSNIINYFHQ